MDDGSHQWPVPSRPLAHVWKNLVQPHIVHEGSHEELESKNPCKYRFLKESFLNVPLIGKLIVDAKSGFFQICDNSCQINLVFTSESTVPKSEYFINLVSVLFQCLCKCSNSFFAVQSLVKITKYFACSEFYSVNNKSWTLEYIIVHDFKSLIVDQAEAELLNGHTFHVQLLSHPLKMGNLEEMSHILAVLSQQHNEEKFLRIPAKLGLDLTHSTLVKVNFSVSEKYSPTLQKFLKTKLIQERPAKIIDVTEAQVLQRQHKNTEVYQIPDLYQVQDNELISVEGTLAEKWLELSKYNDPTSGELMSHTDLELKLKDDQGSRISLYITKWDSKANIIGLIPGLRIRCNNVTKTTSRKNNVYLVTTFFSHFQVLSIGATEDPIPQVNVAENEGSYNFLALHKGNLQAIYCLLSLEKVIKVSIAANCTACGNAVKNGLCSFVGCHAGKYVL